MKKVLIQVLITCLLCLGVSTAFAQDKISNVIVFGDSLSDIGNFPEAHRPLITSHDLPSWHHLSPMFYVPISNPVDRRPNAYKVPITTLFDLPRKPYHWPALNQDNLTPQPPLVIQGKSYSRLNRSLGWAEFLVSFASQDHLMSSGKIYPWVSLVEHPKLKANIHTSVNYAWATATSFNRCNYFKDFQAVSPKDCSPNAIMAARKAYQRHPNSAHYLNLIIPGMLKQVDFFMGDVRNKKVKVGNDTAYIIYIGGNDLLDDYERFMSGDVVNIMNGIGNMAYWNSRDVYEAARALILNPDIQAKHIYIVSLLPPSLSPAVREEGEWAGNMADLIASYYNHELYGTVKDINEAFPNHPAVYVPGAQWYENMAHDPRYWELGVFDPEKMSYACELSDDRYMTLMTPKSNCRGYLFWNSIHPTMAAQAIFAYRFLQLLSD